MMKIERNDDEKIRNQMIHWLSTVCVTETRFVRYRTGIRIINTNNLCDTLTLILNRVEE